MPSPVHSACTSSLWGSPPKTARIASESRQSHCVRLKKRPDSPRVPPRNPGLRRADLVAVSAPQSMQQTPPHTQHSGPNHLGLWSNQIRRDAGLNARRRAAGRRVDGDAHRPLPALRRDRGLLQRQAARQSLSERVAQACVYSTVLHSAAHEVSSLPAYAAKAVPVMSSGVSRTMTCGHDVLRARRT